MVSVRFYQTVDDALLRFAVIVAKHHGQFVFCRHRERSTLEIPGGHREPGEAIDETARRELYEETGASAYTIEPVCVYSVAAPGDGDGGETFGMLYAAQIETFERELHSEIAQIVLMNALPDAWTYPEIQPKLIQHAKRLGAI